MAAAAGRAAGRLVGPLTAALGLMWGNETRSDAEIIRNVKVPDELQPPDFLDESDRALLLSYIEYGEKQLGQIPSWLASNNYKKKLKMSAVQKQEQAVKITELQKIVGKYTLEQQIQLKEFMKQFSFSESFTGRIFDDVSRAMTRFASAMSGAPAPRAANAVNAPAPSAANAAPPATNAPAPSAPAASAPSAPANAVNAPAPSAANAAPPATNAPAPSAPAASAPSAPANASTQLVEPTIVVESPRFPVAENPINIQLGPESMQSILACLATGTMPLLRISLEGTPTGIRLSGVGTNPKTALLVLIPLALYNGGYRTIKNGLESLGETIKNLGFVEGGKRKWLRKTRKINKYKRLTRRKQ